MTTSYCYSYQKYNIPKATSFSHYNSEMPCSPLSYSDDEMDQENEEQKELHHAHNNHINNKQDLVNLVIKVIYQNLQYKFQLNFNNEEIVSFQNLINLLIGKCNLSLSNLTKNFFILEKILLHYAGIDNDFSFNLFKRMILISFVLGSSSIDNDDDNKFIVNFSKWSTITGLTSSYLQKEIFNFVDSANINSEISNIDVENLNARLQLQVQQYVQVL